MEQLSPQLLEPIDLDRRVIVSCMGVNAYVPTMLMPPSKLSLATNKLKQCCSKGAQQQSAAPQERHVLYNINAACQPGEVLALMGPSGGGKTTLLSVMGGRTPKYGPPTALLLALSNRYTGWCAPMGRSCTTSSP